jgi:transposase
LIDEATSRSDLLAPIALGLYEEGHSTREVSEILEIGKSYANYLIRRARKKRRWS